MQGQIMNLKILPHFDLIGKVTRFCSTGKKKSQLKKKTFNGKMCLKTWTKNHLKINFGKLKKK